MSQLLYDIALTRIYMVGPRSARALINHLGSARAVFDMPASDLRRLGAVGAYISDDNYRSEALRSAEKELEYMQRHNIYATGIQNPAYPQRLAQCPDAPVVLYHTSRQPLLSDKVVAVVGTRRISSYGRDLTDNFIADIAAVAPETLIVSGLAYGVDITAHRASLRHGLSTIGVVAHGLDLIYPSSHRNTAEEMCRNGGAVMTEYPTHTRPDPQNFVQRNRIIAGLADATVVIESAAKGGSLITAEVANDYNRDVMAFPGRVGDPFSAGCNNLISCNKAQLISSAADFVRLMGWDVEKPQAVQQSLFPDQLPADQLSPDQQKIVDALTKGPLHINEIARAAEMTIQQASVILTNMVFDDILRQLPGDRYETMLSNRAF